MRTSERGAGVAAARRNRPVRCVFVVSGRDELNSGFRLRDVDVTSFAGARLTMQRGEDARHDEARRYAVGPRTKRAPRRTVGPSDQITRARHRSAPRSDAGGAHRMRPGLPENTGGGHYDVVFALFQMRVVKLQTLEHAGCEALEHDIGPIDEAQD